MREVEVVGPHMESGLWRSENCWRLGSEMDCLVLMNTPVMGLKEPGRSMG